MTLTQAIDEFGASKKQLLPILERDKLVVPIYRTEECEGHFEGDGFFLGSKGKFCYKHGGMGYDSPSTLKDLIEAYHEFGLDLRPEEALVRTTQTLNDWYDELS